MPNWCSNNIVVTGDINKLVEFDNKFKAEHIVYSDYDESDESEISYDKTKYEICLVDGLKVLKTKVEGYSLENFVSMPEEYAIQWYKWRTTNWGTKWDVADFSEDILGLADESEPYVAYCFNTAWSPCEQVVEAMAKEFPELNFEFTYDEEVMCYAGLKKYSGGVRIENYESDEDYREFKHQYLDYQYYKCKGCNELIEVYEYEDEDRSCPTCGSKNIYGLDHKTLLEQKAQ